MCPLTASVISLTLMALVRRRALAAATPARLARRAARAARALPQRAPLGAARQLADSLCAARPVLRCIQRPECDRPDADDDEEMTTRSESTRPVYGDAPCGRGCASAVHAAVGACVQGFPPMGKRRLDTLLAERGLFPSRTRAAASVMAGEVRVGARRAPRGQAGRAGRRRGAAERRAAPRLRLARRHQARQRARLAAGCASRAARARRRRLDGRLHRLPAPAGRARGDRRRRRLRDCSTTACAATRACACWSAPTPAR